MFSCKDNFERKNTSRRDFVKLMGAGSLFVGLGALGISNILKNIREASAMTASANMQQIQLMLQEQLQQIQLMLQEQL